MAESAVKQEGSAVKGRAHRRVQRGVVTSASRHKTITVLNEWSWRHPKYGKIIRQRSKLHVHDPENSAKEGDLVEVMACRPLSKQKSWRLVRIIKRAAGE